jgi:TonB family protein
MAYPPSQFPALSLFRSSLLCRIVVAAAVITPVATAAQTPAMQSSQQQSSPSPAQPAATNTPQITAEPQAVSSATLSPAGTALPVSEEVLARRLVGKQFFLRGGWLGDSLSFTEHGFPVGHPNTGSFTLSVIQVNKVDLNKHRLEIEGSRYALHFLGNLPYENSANEVERVNITPKKKSIHISIERERLLKNKKYAHSQSAAAPATAQPSPETTEPAEAMPAPLSDTTYTTSPAHAAQVLNEALDRIFATALDDKMREHLPEFWQLYYQSQRTGKRFDPHDGNVLRAGAVDQQARLLTAIAPQSNEFAQANGVVGQALYRVVVGADGTPQQIAAERPIGFGLDENAVAAIRKATFQPAVKNGQPVAELLDLSVLFRIYSDRTNATSSAQSTDDTSPTTAPAAVKPALPGPYSAQHPAQDAPDTNTQPATDSQPSTPPAGPQTTPQTPKI